MLRLIAQVKYQAPDFRDEAYDQTGLTVEDPSKELEGLDEAFDFADWAYDEFTYEETLAKSLANRGFSLVRHDKTTLPGCVAHYIAISKERKIALIGIKGTSHFEDLLTDCCGQAIQHDLGSSFVEGGPTEISCHEGIFAAANRLANDIEVLLDELLLPNKYNLLVTGHSLGAGVAALLGVILRSRIPALRRNEEKRLKVLAFASPPILDHDSALACNDFCTTIVNNSDVIPRSSVCNLMIMVEFLKIVGTKLDEKDMSLTSFESAGAFLKMLTDDLDGQMLLAPDEIKAGMRAATEKVELRDPQHLYVAGKILHMYDLWSKTTTEDTDKPSIETRTAERLTITDGTSSMLRYIEMDDRMITDHLSPCYRSSIKCLLQKV